VVEVRANYNQNRPLPYIHEGQISPATPFNFDYVNMEAVLAYVDMFTLDQMQMLFRMFNITVRERTKMKMAIQFYRATVHQEMPTPKQWRTLRAIAVCQYPGVTPQEVTSYHRCEVAIKMRMICADPADNRPTEYVNSNQGQPATALSRLWGACFTTSTPREVEIEHHNHNLETRCLHGPDVHRTMVEYNNALLEQFHTVLAPHDEQRTQYQDDDEDVERYRQNEAFNDSVGRP